MHARVCTRVYVHMRVDVYICECVDECRQVYVNVRSVCVIESRNIHTNVYVYM